ncbi:hypothetical protein MNB_SM-4-1157 [hydrothermal vent metagenome]|uniref:Uncharacterized protein n=1 Tax=hydrothermal vent metagenome TaxID=652676 RepID=A0A1W1CF35_9ZZZZ
MNNIQFKNLDNLLSVYKEALKDNRNLYYFPSDESQGLLIEREKNFLARLLDDTKELSESNLAMQRSYNTYLLYAQYALVALEDKELCIKNFSISSLYGSLAIYLTANTSGCFDAEKDDVEEVLLINQGYLSQYISSLILCAWWDEVDKNINLLKQDLEHKNAHTLIVTQDNQLETNLYFILALHAKMNKIELDIGEFELPSFTHPYDKILQIYDTKDIKEVDRWVYLLCDTRLELIKENKNFKHITTQLFAYEILAWLAIRKEIGLQNPKEFSHPLMSIPIVKLFLQIQTPLPKPTKLLYVDELLEKIASKCLDVKIDNDALSQNKTPLSNTLAPKTGRYRATLPNTHLQANQLEGDPHSYARFLKDDTFIYEGLEDYDLSEITWSYIGD